MSAIAQLKRHALKPIAAFSCLLLAVTSCEIEEAPPYGRVGNEVRFSGWDWYVKTGPAPLGPGPNLFSDRAEDIFIDGQGYLHMRIAENDGSWYSTEVVSYDTVGYGEYTWVISGDYENIPNNTVLGLFTWNTEGFFEEANSEVDIEFAKWNDPNAKTLHTSVQPVNFGPYYPERTYEHNTEDGDLIGVSTHQYLDRQLDHMAQLERKWQRRGANRILGVLRHQSGTSEERRRKRIAAGGHPGSAEKHQCAHEFLDVGRHSTLLWSGA